MQDECLFASSLLLVHINAARDAAEESAKKIAALHERALLAESQIKVCEAQFLQKAAEHAALAEQLQQCQCDCDLLKQQVLALHDELELESAALTAEAQERAALQQQLHNARQAIHHLECQLTRAGKGTDALHLQLQEHLQDLHAELAETNSSRECLARQIRQNQQQLQQHGFVPEAEATSTGVPRVAGQLQQPRDVQQQQLLLPEHDLALLQAQVTKLTDRNAELAVANAALEQQLNVSKAQIVLLHQQLALATGQKQQQEEEEQQQRQEQQTPQLQGANTVRDRAYYKRKYHELRQKNADLEQELSQIQQQKQELLGHQQQQKTGQPIHRMAPADGINGRSTPRDNSKPSADGNSAGARKLHRSHGEAQAPHVATVQSAVGQPKANSSRQTAAAAAAAVASAMLTCATAAAAGAHVAAVGANACAGDLAPQAKRRKPNYAADAEVAVTAENTAAVAYSGDGGRSNSKTMQQQQQHCRPTDHMEQHQLRCSHLADVSAAQDATAVVTAVAPVRLQDMPSVAAAAALLTSHIPPAAVAAGRHSSSPEVESRHTSATHAQCNDQAKAAPAAHMQRTAPTKAVDKNVASKQSKSTAGAGAASAERGMQGSDGRQQQLAQQQGVHISNTSSSPAWKVARSKSKGASAVPPAVVAGVSDQSRKRQHSKAAAGNVEAAAAGTAADAAAQDAEDSEYNDFELSTRQQQQQHPKRKQRQPPATKSKHRKASTDQQAAAAAVAGGQPAAESADDEFDLSTQPQQQQPRRQQQQAHVRQAGQEQRLGSDASSNTCVQQQHIPGPEQQQQQQQASGGRKRYMPTDLQQGQQQLQSDQLGTNAAATEVDLGAAAPHHTATAGCEPIIVTKQQRQQPIAHGLMQAPLPQRRDQQPLQLQQQRDSNSATAGSTAAASRSSAVVGQNKTATAEPGYKYQEVVRKKAERELLPAFECDACRKFYGAIQSWGAAALQQLGLPSCGHQAPTSTAAAPGGSGSTAAAAGHSATGVQQQEQQEAGGGVAVRRIVQDASRHRAKWKPPSTPAGFWDIGFTQDMPSGQH